MDCIIEKCSCKPHETFEGWVLGLFRYEYIMVEDKGFRKIFPVEYIKNMDILHESITIITDEMEVEWENHSFTDGYYPENPIEFKTIKN